MAASLLGNATQRGAVVGQRQRAVDDLVGVVVRPGLDQSLQQQPAIAQGQVAVAVVAVAVCRVTKIL